MSLAVGAAGSQPVRVSQPTAVHTKTVEFDTLSLSHEDLFTVLSRIRRFIASANAGLELGDIGEDSLVIANDHTSYEIDLRNGFTVEHLKGAPSGPTQIAYRYRAYNTPTLKSVILNLTDLQRSLTVAGTSVEHMDGLVGIASTDLKQHRTYFAVSSATRSALGAVLIILGILLLTASTSLPDQRWRTLAAVAGACVQLSVWFVPWKRWLAGVSLYPDTASFAERNAAAISLIALLLGVVALLVTLFQILQSRQSPPSS